MLGKMMIRRFDKENCRYYLEDAKEGLAITAIRLRRLKATKARNPGWATYDKYAEEIVGIDTYIEMQIATQEDIEDDVRLINERLDILMGLNVIQSSDTPAQLGFFDTDAMKARMGAI